MSEFASHLSSLIDEHVGQLPGVNMRPMFGCDAFFVRGHIFSLVWDGRIGVRLPETKAFDEAMALDGAEPWNPSGARKGFANWVLLPEELHDDDEAIGSWLLRARKMNETSSAAPVKVSGVKKKKPRRSA